MACVLVHIEAEGDRPTGASLGALGAGRRLASRFGATLYAVVLTAAQARSDGAPDAEATVRIGPIDPASLGRAPLVDALARGGADRVVFVAVERLHHPTLWANAGGALAAACAYLRPLVVLMPQSRGVHDLAPRLAARLGAVFVPDAELELGDAAVAAQRKVYGGHTRRWVLDDLDGAAVLVIQSAAPATGGDEAEVMLLSVDAPDDPRIAPEAEALPDAPAPAPAVVAVLVRGLLSGPGTRAAAPVGTVERGAIQTAVELAQAHGAQVVAIAAGAAAIHDRALAAALAAGCTRALRIDATLADEVDYLGLAQILAQAVRRVAADVVVCGDRSSDEATGAVGPAVAEQLDAGHLTGIDAIERADGVLLARRGGERYRVRPPAVLCVALPPRDPAATAAAAPPAIEVATLEDLGLDAAVLLHRRTGAGAITSGATVDTLPGVPIPDFGAERP